MLFFKLKIENDLLKISIKIEKFNNIAQSPIDLFACCLVLLLHQE